MTKAHFPLDVHDATIDTATPSGGRMHDPLRSLLLACAGLAGCASPEYIRGTDRDALLTAGRARWPLRQDRPSAAPNRVSFRPTMEAGAVHVDGDFEDATGRVDYRATLGHVAFAPELRWHEVRAGPLIGLGYGEVEAASITARAAAEGLGFAAGVEAAWQGLTWVEPYVRYSGAIGGEWEIGRFEAGIELRTGTFFGVQIAYARQTSKVDDFEELGGDTHARIESEGLHLGVSLRW